MAIIVVTVLMAGVAASFAWAVHIIRVGARDSGDLAAKLAVPVPRRAADWPELRLDAVVPDPETAAQVLLLVRWPAHPERRALLVLDVDIAAGQAHRLLMCWRDLDASLSPRAIVGDRLVLRRRCTKDTVSALVVRETLLVGNQEL
jgi:hypothetical protein